MSGKFETALGMEAADTVTGDFIDAIDTMLGENIGRRGRLDDYEWADDDNEDWPFTVIRDGREFEVDIDVTVTELTPEVKAKREADARRMLEALEAHRERQAAKEAQR